MTSSNPAALPSTLRVPARAAARGVLAIGAVAATTVAALALLDAGVLAPALLAIALLTVPAIVVLGGLFLLGSGFLVIAEAAHEATVRDAS